MSDVSTILIIEDERSVRDGLIRVVYTTGFKPLAAEGIAVARDCLTDQENEVACILLDLRLKDGDGLSFLSEIRTRWPKIPVVIATAYGDSDRTIQAMKLGAFEYITKPFDLELLKATLQRAVRAYLVTTKSDNNYGVDEPQADSFFAKSNSKLIGSSVKMLEVWKAIGRASASDVPVLITGESGVGKELVARAIHENSERKTNAFIAVNLAALPPTLIESELFGHEKGSFTGAVGRREGRFELASAGTIFLDEIGDLEWTLQTKLLRVLQDGTFERVGGQSTHTSRARVIAATNKPVDPKTKGTTLREDLFYRIGVIRIEVPPLRERKSDIPILVESYLESLAQKSSTRKRRAVSEAAMHKMLAYSWPGNVRELVHVLERACVMSPSEVLDESDINIQLTADTTSALDEQDTLDLHAATSALEKRLILRALQKTQGNRAEAARLLGIARSQLYVKLKEFGLDTPENT